jgi:large subunit ribosomal protein L22
MEVKAKANFIKIAPRKVRLVAGLVRGLKAEEALEQLKNSKKHAADSVSKLIISAIANATNNYELAKENLFIKEIKVDGGPTQHRWMPRARGRATPLRKRSSHINLVLSELVPSTEKKAKKQKIEEPVKLGGKVKEDKGIKIKGKDEDLKSSGKKTEEKGKTIIDPRSEGKGKHTKIEGKSYEGFAKKIFRRKAG